ncbi:MAG: NAD(+)/NADH kinase [Candidatus Bathyarchaeia archaeon]
MVKVGLISKLDSMDALKLSFEVYKYLLDLGIETIPELEFAKRMGLKNGKALPEIFADLLITIGGDGTILKTCMEVSKPETPILAINMGKRGFLAEVPPKEAFNAIKRYLEGDYRLEKHLKISVFLDDKKLVDGLNEALIAPSLPSKMLNFEISINDEKLLETRADALITSTPTGSMAHAFSAGGPIIDNSLDVILLVFLCPLEHIHPIIVPSRSKIKIKVLTLKPTSTIIVDGRYRHKVLMNKTISIEESMHKAVFVRFGKSFFHKNISRLFQLKG